MERFKDETQKLLWESYQEVVNEYTEREDFDEPESNIQWYPIRAIFAVRLNLNEHEDIVSDKLKEDLIDKLHVLEFVNIHQVGREDNMDIYQVEIDMESPSERDAMNSIMQLEHELDYIDHVFPRMEVNS
jgi:hypothetical protein